MKQVYAKFLVKFKQNSLNDGQTNFDKWVILSRKGHHPKPFFPFIQKKKFNSSDLYKTSKWEQTGICMLSWRHSRLMANEYTIKQFKRNCFFFKVFCQLGTFVLLSVRDICDVILSKEKSVFTNKITISKTSVELNIMFEAQGMNHSIKITVFS